MAVLTWRNVDSPSFVGAQHSLNSVGNFLNDGFRSISAGLSGFEAAQTAKADQAVSLEALKYSDPAAYQEALANGSLMAGVDPRRLPSSAITSLGDRVNTLLTQGINRQNLSDAAYKSDRIRTGDELMDAAQTEVNNYLRARAANDGNPDRFLGEASRRLRPEQLTDMLTTGGNLANTELGNDKKAFDLSVDKRDDADTQSAREVLAQILPKALTGGDALAGLERLRETLSPSAFLKAQDALGKMFGGDLYGPLGTAGAAAAGAGTSGGASIDAGTPSVSGSAGTRQGNPFDVTYQFKGTDKPITSMKIGEVIEHQKGMIKDQGHSPVGAFQINKATLEDFAPRVLGDNWRDQPLNAENQDKIAEALFNARKSGNLKETWAALPDATPGAYANREWSDVRQEIARREVGANIGARIAEQSQVQAALDSVTRANTEANANNSTAAIAELANDDSSVAVVADRLIEGPLKGFSRGEVIARLNEVQTNGRMNAAQAGRVVEDSITGRDSGFGNLFSRGAAWAGNVLLPGQPFNDSDVAINEERLAQEVANQRSPAALTTQDQNAQRAILAQSIQQADARVATARQQLQQAEARAAVQPGVRELLPRYRAAVAEAEMSRASLLSAQQNLPGFYPTRVAPPTTVVTSEGVDADAAARARAQRTQELLDGIPIVDTSDAIPQPLMQGRIEGR